MLVSASASAQRDSKFAFNGSNEISVGLGYQFGLGGQFGNPTGFKLFFDYGRRITDLVWLDFQLNPVFGYGPSNTGICYDPRGHAFACGFSYYYGGYGLEFAGGVKLKFPLRIPLVIEVPITLAVMGMFDRVCGDDGAALLFRTGGEVKYFVTRWLGVGGGVHVAFGPGFHGSSSSAVCSYYGSYNDFAGFVDVDAGVEFVF
jgi:hypothetical protein